MFDGTKTTPTVISPLTDAGSWYVKVGKVVYANVAITGMTAGTSYTAYTLPVGSRPLTNIYIKACSTTYDKIADCVVRASDGAIRIASSSNSVYALAIFLAEH